MGKSEQDMARGCFGYGSWESPYWFIGLEEGKGRNETADNTPRVIAWDQLGAQELSDCYEFHRLIGETRYHDQGKLQSTWRPLILLLMSYLGRSTDTEDLRIYQRTKWGKFGAETCVIELSGLAAKNLGTAMDRESFRQERIDIISERIRTYKPELVVMYGGGRAGRKTWKNMVGLDLKQDEALKLKSQSTIALLAKHPIAPGPGNDYWVQLGEKARKLSH